MLQDLNGQFPSLELMLSIEVAKCLLGGMRTSVPREGGNLFMPSLKIDGNSTIIKKTLVSIF